MRALVSSLIVHCGNGRVVGPIDHRVFNGKSDVVGPIHLGVSSNSPLVSIHMVAAVLWYLGPKYLGGGAMVPVGWPTPTASIHITSVWPLELNCTCIGSSPSLIR